MKEDKIAKPWTFEQIQLKNCDFIPNEWVLKINNLQQLFDYYQLTRPSMIRSALNDFTKTTENNDQRDEFTKAVTHAVRFIGSVKTETESRDISFIEGISKLFNQVEKNQIDSLVKGKTLYIRDIGSYVSDSGSKYIVLNSFQSKDLIFPQAQIRLIQWPNGTHWYAKIGNVDVIVDDEQKWNTKKEALNNAEIFLSRNWKPILKEKQ